MQYHIRLVVDVARHLLGLREAFAKASRARLNYHCVRRDLARQLAAGVTSTTDFNVCGRILKTSATPRRRPSPRPLRRHPTPTATAPRRRPHEHADRDTHRTPTPGSYVNLTPGAAGHRQHQRRQRARNTVDNNMATRCRAAATAPGSLRPGCHAHRGYITIAFYSGNQRQTRFDVQVSGDGTPGRRWPRTCRAAGPRRPPRLRLPGRRGRYVGTTGTATRSTSGTA